MKNEPLTKIDRIRRTGIKNMEIKLIRCLLVVFQIDPKVAFPRRAHPKVSPRWFRKFDIIRTNPGPICVGFFSLEKRRIYYQNPS